MIWMFLANGFEEIEALAPLDLLRRAGETVVTVGIGGREVTGAHGICVMADTTDAALPHGMPEMVILPGGMPGTAHLDACPAVETVLEGVRCRGGHLAAICAAPMVLGKRGYLAGKQATCFPGFEEYLTDAQIRSGGVVTDGSVTTAAGMGVAIEFGLALVAVRQGQDRADALRAAIQMPPR